MKSAVLLAAMLSGLCAEATAVPIPAPPRTAGAPLNDAFATPTPVADLDFNAASPDGDSWAEEQNRETDEEFAADTGDATGSTPEPVPAFYTIIAGGLMLSLGLAAVGCQLLRDRRSHRHRRVIRMLAATAGR